MLRRQLQSGARLHQQEHQLPVLPHPTGDAQVASIQRRGVSLEMRSVFQQN
jgi:hypothetical protein